MIRPRRPGSPARLTPRRRLLVDVAGLGLWGSGALWLVFHYFVVGRGAFGPERSPLEPWWLKLHGGFAFLSLWTGGLLWGVHVVHGWRMHRRRWSGSLLLGLLGLLIVSGLLLYYVGEEGRAVVSLIHWAVGLALPLLYLAHRLATRPRPLRGGGARDALRKAG